MKGKAKKQAVVTAAASGLVVPVDPPLGEFIRQCSGGEMSRRDQQLLWGIEELFHRGQPTIAESDLLKLAGHADYFYDWRVKQVMLWPKSRPPRSLMELWLYVAYALRELDKLPMVGAFRHVPWDRVERLVAPLVRDREIRHWQGRLVECAEEPVAAKVSPVFRIRLSEHGAQVEWCWAGTTQFEPLKQIMLRRLVGSLFSPMQSSEYVLDEAAWAFISAMQRKDSPQVFFKADPSQQDDELPRLLNVLIRSPFFEGAVVSPAGVPLIRESEPLCWHLEGPVVSEVDRRLLDEGRISSQEAGEYVAELRMADGTPAPRPLTVLPGQPFLHVTMERVYAVSGTLSGPAAGRTTFRIPVEALESDAGLVAMEKMGVALPESLSRRVIVRPVKVKVICRVHRPHEQGPDFFQIWAVSSSDGYRPDERWSLRAWRRVDRGLTAVTSARKNERSLVRLDASVQRLAADWLSKVDLTPAMDDRLDSGWQERRLQGAFLRDFPGFFHDWLASRPEGVEVELDPELASIRDGKVSGTVRLEAEEAGVDWFDLRVALDVSDVELNQEEVDLLLKAQGRWVRLPGKGWRRLDFAISDEERGQLADLGLGVGDMASGEKQRFHVLQLAGAAATRMLDGGRVEQVQRRAAELRVRVSPDVPAAITASLRPYQREGYHFLAYLAANRFGGILADDMGLGKTIQTLSWLAWLRETGQLKGPVLVVCPKSVQDNWRAEVERFYASLRVRLWSRDEAGQLDDPVPVETGRKSRQKVAAAASLSYDILIINYTQLRLHEEALVSRPWSVVILDEAQYIKNPSSHTTKVACALVADFRLALSGTPIENRLLDLWSIMNFAMPGVLASRAAFGRIFNGKDDPLARRRLSARVRPFVLRRTKKEVASDLPDRIEEEIVCEMEGSQATLYRAEVKRARAMLLKVKTSAQLDKLRFHILTSLLRLRQICCHPVLVGAGKPGDVSAKLVALMELLEPLMEEGHKVLVFSQFVEMLELIRTEVVAREWPHFLLTGQTEERGAMVDSFQRAEGASIFLISLKAGGSGLNLTAASYVVLFDPWWNPAVENQAIDRTHRIGQVNKVIAYRLLVRDTIEEKIRQLQKRKSALATDVLGEEGFAKALTIDDFRFLLGGGEDGTPG
jgi:hypothetical protein